MSGNFNDYINVRQVELEKILFEQHMSVSETMLLDPQAQVTKNAIFKTFDIRIQGFLWSRTIQTHKIAYPLDWWQAVKLRWFPEWALRRWPIRQEVKIIELKAIWPTIRTLVPKHQPRLVVIADGDPIGSYGGETFVMDELTP